MKQPVHSEHYLELHIHRPTEYSQLSYKVGNYYYLHFREQRQNKPSKCAESQSHSQQGAEFKLRAYLNPASIPHRSIFARATQGLAGPPGMDVPPSPSYSSPFSLFCHSGTSRYSEAALHSCSPSQQLREKPSTQSGLCHLTDQFLTHLPAGTAHLPPGTIHLPTGTTSCSVM